MKAIFSAITGALGGKLLPIIIGALVVLVAGYVVIEKNRDKTMVNTGKEAGAAAAVNAGQQATLEQIRKSNEGRNEITGGRSDADFTQCLRDSAAGYEGGCDRYRPIAILPD